jgi:ubiquinone/menaquinone biosynthesis C-methylase UbiE
MNINAYGRQLSLAEIDAKEHRTFVGGLWDEIGMLQFDFLKEYGLEPHHQLVDVGCGALRGGIPIARYLDAGHYHGIDINASLITAAKRELEEAGLEAKNACLLVNDKFELSRFGVNFDYAIAVSLFTHLPINHIVRCLVEARRVLKPKARFFATYFEAPAKVYLDSLHHTPGNIVTNYDADPYHYALEEFQWMAAIAELEVARIGEWRHPRDQRMLAFWRAE